jgi:hypothetical protein
MHLDILVVRFRQKFTSNEINEGHSRAARFRSATYAPPSHATALKVKIHFASGSPGLIGCNPVLPAPSYGPLPKGIAWRDNSAPFAIYSVAIKTKNLDIHVCVCVCHSWNIMIAEFTGYRDQENLLARLTYSRVDRILHSLHPPPHSPAMAAQSPHVLAFLDCFPQRVTSAPGPCARAVTCKCMRYRQKKL